MSGANLDISITEFLPELCVELSAQAESVGPYVGSELGYGQSPTNALKTSNGLDGVAVALDIPANLRGKEEESEAYAEKDEYGYQRVHRWILFCCS